jgi:hypothetical protein
MTPTLVAWARRGASGRPARLRVPHTCTIDVRNAVRAAGAGAARFPSPLATASVERARVSRRNRSTHDEGATPWLWLARLLLQCTVHTRRTGAETGLDTMHDSSGGYVAVGLAVLIVVMGAMG